MPVDRIKRVNELLKREIGGALFRVINEENYDLSAVTITSVSASRNLRNAKVLVSIRDHDETKHKMLGIIKRHRVEIQAFINRDLVLKYTPRLQFELDYSLEKGDHVLDILADMKDENTEDQEIL